MSHDTIHLFDGKGAVYDASRPDYAPELIRYLYGRGGLTPSHRIADIGAGTGKWAEQLVKQGNFLYAVEPNDDMRRALAQRLHPYVSAAVVKGAAEHTTLPSASVQWVTAAQAFHWFHTAAFRAECRRILQPGGTVLLLWNNRQASSPLVREWAAVFQTYCSSFHGFSNGMAQKEERILQFFGQNTCTRLAFSHPLHYSESSFLSRSLSSSYSLRRGDKNYESYLSALRALFSAHARQGILTVPNQTVAYLGHI